MGADNISKILTNSELKYLRKIFSGKSFKSKDPLTHDISISDKDLGLLKNLFELAKPQLQADLGNLTLKFNVLLKQSPDSGQYSLRLRYPVITKNKEEEKFNQDMKLRSLRVHPKGGEISLSDECGILTNTNVFDISTSGMAIGTTSDLPAKEGAHLKKLSLQLPSDKYLSMSCKIIRVDQNIALDKLTLGVKFEKPTKVLQNSIISYILKKHRKRGKL